MLEILEPERICVQLGRSCVESDQPALKAALDAVVTAALAPKASISSRGDGDLSAAAVASAVAAATATGLGAGSGEGPSGPMHKLDAIAEANKRLVALHAAGAKGVATARLAAGG
jgi:hypothetical protein